MAITRINNPFPFQREAVVRVEYRVLEITDHRERSIHFPPTPVSGIKELAPSHQQADGFRFPPFLGQFRC